MKSLIPFTFICLALFIGCKKETTNNGGALLRQVTVDGKLQESFEYNSENQLIKDYSYFMGCTSPTDELFYMYKNKQLDSLKSVIRSLYSSTSPICNPLAGIRYYSAFEYDTQGRINKIIKDNSVISLFYNTRGLVEKQTISGGGTNLYISTYKYDTRGNLTEVTDGQGNITRYEFDTKINPYYLIKRHPDIITAFIVSPNNVVRVNYASGNQIIKYEYNSQGLPDKMFDPNGLTYVFVYQ